MDVIARGLCTDRWMPHHVRPRPVGGPCRVDLRHARWIDPLGLVLVASVLDRAVNDGLDVVFTGPRDSELASYLSRMGMAALLDGWGVGHGFSPVPKGPGERIVELTRFRNPAEALALDEHVFRLFVGLDGGVARALAAAVSEITANTLEHSGLAHGFLALQQFTTGTHPGVAFAVGDSGVGLRTTLARRVRCETDARAVELAVQRRTSGAEPRRGLGLPSVVRIAAERGGAVRLWSGDAFTVVGGPVTAPRGNLAGTVVHARLVVR